MIKKKLYLELEIPKDLHIYSDESLKACISSHLSNVFTCAKIKVAKVDIEKDEDNDNTMQASKTNEMPLSLLTDGTMCATRDGEIVTKHYTNKESRTIVFMRGNGMYLSTDYNGKCFGRIEHDIVSIYPGTAKDLRFEPCKYLPKKEENSSFSLSKFYTTWN